MSNLGQNPEQTLILELVAAVQGKKVQTEVYKNVPAVAESLGGQGSQNWPVMGASVRYMTDPASARDSLLAYYEKSKKNFMGSELFSTEYGLWGHCLPNFAILSHAVSIGDKEIANAAREWLRFYWGVYAACTTSSGEIITVGWRGAPWHDPQQFMTWLAWVRDFSFGGGARWEVQGKTLGLGMQQSSTRAIAVALEPTILEVIKSVMDSPPELSYATATPIHIVRGAQSPWMAVYLEGNGNGNTPPLMAGVYDGHGFTYMPQNVARQRQVFDHATVELSPNGNILTYTSSLYGSGTISVPQNIAHVVIGAGSSAPVQEPTRPSPTPSPSSGLDLAQCASIIRGLQVSRRDAAVRDRLAQELEGPQRPLKAIADDLLGLGIGEAQEQATRWHKVIDWLREQP